MRRFGPLGKFLCCYLPGLGLALALGRLAGPGPLTPLMLLSVAFLAFAVAVSAAATPPARGVPPGREGRILAILSIRRHRWRHAAGFAVAGAAAGAVAIRLAGGGVAPLLTAGHLALSVGVLFVAARVIIGEAACSQEAIRRALLREIERT